VNCRPVQELLPSSSTIRQAVPRHIAMTYSTEVGQMFLPEMQAGCTL